MTDIEVPTARRERELFEATRPFESESIPRSWGHVASTFAALLGLLVMAAMSTWWPLRLVASFVSGLVLVRAFILFHDFQHGSLLRGSRSARLLFRLFGLVALTPSANWRHSHNFHHAHVEKPITPVDDAFTLATSDVGSFPLLTVDGWRRASGWQRLRYRLTRHPLTIACGYVTVFLGGLCVVPFLKESRRNWESLLSLTLHLGIGTVLWSLGGLPILLFVWLLPFAIGGAVGAYLFFAQHNVPGLRVLPAEEWSHYRGALESSSYVKLGPVMSWFTGNIGYHHVHHMNARIPFYRLPEAMAAIPELQHPVTTSLRPRDVLACLRLSLWDPERRELVGFNQVGNVVRRP